MARGRTRNSCADANVSACHPSHRINNSRDSRTDTSSSTTKTIDVTSVRASEVRGAVGEFGAYDAAATLSVNIIVILTSDAKRLWLDAS
jgi:hypothetical protein